MLNRDELKIAFAATVGADQTVGSAIPVNMRRFIYRVRFDNLAAGLNTLVVGKRENGAVGTTVIDTLTANVTGDYTDPEELHEDSAPLYVIDGGPSGGATATTPPSTSLVRFASPGTGNVTYWYVDEPA